MKREKRRRGERTGEGGENGDEKRGERREEREEWLSTFEALLFMERSFCSNTCWYFL